MTTTEQRVAQAARFVIYVNILLVVGKVAVGLRTGAVSVLSEAAHSGVDLLLSALVWLTLKIARRPADESHPYGHGKVETLTSLGEAFVIFGVAAGVAWEAARALRGGEAVSNVGVGIVTMAITAIIAGVLSRYLLRVARADGSPALEAMGAEIGTDMFAALGVFGGLVLVRLTGWRIIDPLVGLGVAGVIAFNGGRVLVRAIWGLTDAQLPRDEVNAIRGVLDAHADSFLEYHALRTRHVGGTHAVDLHLVVPHDMSVGQAHALSTHLEDEIAVALPHTEVTIHLEPEEEAQRRRLLDDANRANRRPSAMRRGKRSRVAR